jgi:putative ABC transport system permease protein
MALTGRIVNLFRRNRMHAEIERELSAHIAMRTEDNLRAGMSPKDARRDAFLRFGNTTAISERTTQADSALYLEDLWADIRYACRQLRNAPGFAVASILVLSLGIGASTAIFSAIKPILIDPLPYPNAGRIMMLWETRGNDAPAFNTFGTFHGMAERNRSFESMAVMRLWQPVLAATASRTDHPERFTGQRVSAAFFRTLGVSPKLGRDFDVSDDRFHGPSLVILSDRIWRQRFAANPSIVGSQVRLDDNLYTVIGVMPGAFENVLEPSADLWTPLQYDPSLPPEGREWGHHLRMVARLRSNATREQASREASAILRVLAQTYAKGYDSSGGTPVGMIVTPLQNDLTAGVKPSLMAVLGAAALVLLIACVNTTNLLLARGAQRRAEFAMRAALGAARSRLIRQLLTESLLIALLGAALGMVIAEAGVRALIALSPVDLPRAGAIAIDASVFFFALGITALVGTLVGLIPAWQASGTDLSTGMRQISRRSAGGRRLTRSALVIAEVSLAVVLLIGAGLLLRTMQHLFATDPGFEAQNLLTMQVQETGQRFTDAATGLRFLDDALDRVRRTPGVVSAGFTSQLPLSGDYDEYGIQFDRNGNSGGNSAARYSVTPGYLEAMRIPLRSGRLLDQRDTTGAPGAVLISESLARRIFPGQNPLGQRVRVGPDVGHADRPWATIVGVVGNVKQQSLAIGDGDAFYAPTSQGLWVDNAQSLVVRTVGPPAALAPLIRDAIWSVDRDQPIVRLATMDRLLATSESERHFVLLLFEAFALAGLTLAAIGIYGVLSGSVAERTREIGVRAALGATRGNLLGLILRQGMMLTAVGIVIGLCGAVAASRAIAALLFEVSNLDPFTYAAVALLLLAVAGAACLIPARRAASVNPVDALRAE